MNADALIDAVKWNADGLVCAVAQDFETKKVLMLAWMNAEALRRTAETGFAHYYSRSRQAQWKKGEQSGHVQQVHEMYLDCDGDAIVMLIRQHGGIACHTGRESCFYRVWRNGEWQNNLPVLKPADEIY
ncbi:phosphoribosyl-AMP cyclohydrolase [Conchiformibius steedae DSM 2580]|uniref:Phosphoribosyl-AMP cyclohydrolase n=1 Tax=Conchiformibius steedae DSM 2580 TaxID=1121352 RepID=A0AAE9KZE0_9NEIS|nr:phosphoribosyl-AMP cyclohydrolase [Conchiformibius steedae]QMT34164.1 phosphoribosyl-AMP cyclohydrolase [Conchiformibius steedae]URD66939.1 phosphoribosyl-AMP cyclohydrolase [Conchiformibius steedae DSM 2580]